MSKINSQKKAMYTSEWVDLATISNDYSIDIESLIEAIEEQDISTRGRVYDDKEGPEKTLIEIPAAAWRDFNFGEESGLVRPTSENPLGEKENPYFLFCYQGNISLQGDWEIRSGFIDIQINRSDFEKKIRVVKQPTGTRSHKKIEALRKVYMQMRERKKADWISPKEALEYIKNNCMEKESAIEDFEVEKISYKNKEPFEIHFILADGSNHVITVRRFNNIISEFNNN